MINSFWSNGGFGVLTRVSAGRLIPLELEGDDADNASMELHGLVQNGVIVLSGGLSLPEGTPVTVSCSLEAGSRAPGEKTRIEIPLVRTGKPGTLKLTNERIAEIFDEEDIASARR